jgi:uncharacterized protein
MVEKNDCVAVFTKYPEPGRVKTRLSAGIGPIASAELYNDLVRKTLSTARRSRKDVAIFFDPSSPFERYKKWLGYDYAYYHQDGADLGIRMKNAFSALFDDGYKHAVLVGCDVPSLNEAILSEAFAGLHRGQVSVGPAEDGGYYLVGFSKNGFHGEVFGRKNWGESTVCAELLEDLSRARADILLLPKLIDIDTLSDVEKFIGKNMNIREKERI